MIQYRFLLALLVLPFISCITSCAPSLEERQDLASVQSARISPAIYDKMIHHEALSVYDLAALGQARVNESIIIRYVRNNDTTYFLSSSDVDMLHKAGLSPSLIDYLLSTPKRVQEPVYIYPFIGLHFYGDYGYYGGGGGYRYRR